MNGARLHRVSCNSSITGGLTLHSSFKSHSIPQIERFIVNLWKRFHGEAGASGGVGDDDDIQSVSEDEMEGPTTLMELLKQAVKAQCDDRCQDVTGGGSVKELKNELKLFKKTKIRGAKLEFIFANMKNIQVSSVESERSFSVAGRMCNKLRSRLGDDALSDLTMLYYY